MINFEHNQRCKPEEYDYWRNEREAIDATKIDEVFVLMLVAGGLERAAAKMTIQLRQKAKSRLPDARDLTIIEVDADLKPRGTSVIIPFNKDNLYISNSNRLIFRVGNRPAAEGYLRGYGEWVDGALSEILVRDEVSAVPPELLAA